MNRREVILALLASLLLAVLVSPFASSHPDGLERVAQDKGFLRKSEAAPALPSPIPGYSWPGVQNERLAVSLAGGAGTLAVFALGCLIAAMLRKR